jgi:phage-related minor tail protein
MKLPLVLAGALLLGGTLTACGGDGGADSDYCKDIKKAEKTFSSMSSGDVDQLDAAFKTFHQLADEAPSEVESDWKKLDGAITTVEKALKDAGLKFSDFDDIQKGDIPEGVDVSKLSGLASEFSKLNSDEFTKASQNIEKHAKDTCKVDLGGSA